MRLSFLIYFVAFFVLLLSANSHSYVTSEWSTLKNLSPYYSFIVDILATSRANASDQEGTFSQHCYKGTENSLEWGTVNLSSVVERLFDISYCV
ncbi:hypothetical protein QR680_005452 [Steinernema hermaphroditum]|uniref:Uncharacterized protein n=1 Tax=Steinernema hermaphroditum TaxID=289476 RepID=A0AA39LVP1_9BILA|nr:hypothetical protein QR680_005452 [Steinernema hermaphroditum]